jgi:hypothetical protein
MMKLFLFVWLFSLAFARISEKESMQPEDQLFWNRLLRTGGSMPSGPTPPPPLFQCPSTQQSGGQGQFTFLIDVQRTQGMFDLFYDMYAIPDALEVVYEGTVVFSTNGLVSGSATVSVSYGSAASTSTIISLNLSAPEDGTAWEIFVPCAI